MRNVFVTHNHGRNRKAEDSTSSFTGRVAQRHSRRQLAKSAPVHVLNHSTDNVTHLNTHTNAYGNLWGAIQFITIPTMHQSAQVFRFHFKLF